jgi:hypothetical protein
VADLATINDNYIARRFGRTHGMSHSPEYDAWIEMRLRCKNAIKYPNHAGKGIKVCVEWLGKEGFGRFFAVVGSRPSAQHSLDRYPNKDGNYEPGNVRWATSVQQNNNTNRNHILEYDGRRLSVSQWGRQLGFPRNLIHARLKRGWSVEKALSEPPSSRSRRGRDERDRIIGAKPCSH